MEFRHLSLYSDHCLYYNAGKLKKGDPHRYFPSIHIAGTKGKGSVAAMYTSVLQAAGCRSGLYSSPHLHTFRERIQVNGELIPPDASTALVQECHPALRKPASSNWCPKSQRPTGRRSHGRDPAGVHCAQIATHFGGA